MILVRYEHDNEKCVTLTPSELVTQVSLTKFLLTLTVNRFDLSYRLSSAHGSVDFSKQTYSNGVFTGTFPAARINNKKIERFGVGLQL